MSASAKVILATLFVGLMVLVGNAATINVIPASSIGGSIPDGGLDWRYLRVAGGLVDGGLEVRGPETLDEVSAPSRAPTGACRIYADPTTHTIQQSCNGGAYTVLGGGGSYLPLSGGVVTGPTVFDGGVTVYGTETVRSSDPTYPNVGMNFYQATNNFELTPLANTYSIDVNLYATAGGNGSLLLNGGAGMTIDSKSGLTLNCASRTGCGLSQIADLWGDGYYLYASPYMLAMNYRTDTPGYTVITSTIDRSTGVPLWIDQAGRAGTQVIIGKDTNSGEKLQVAGTSHITGATEVDATITSRQDNTTTTHPDGLLLANTTAATVGVPNQDAPALRFSGHSYAGGEDRTAECVQYVSQNTNDPLIKVDCRYKSSVGYTNAVTLSPYSTNYSAKFPGGVQALAGGFTGDWWQPQSGTAVTIKADVIQHQTRSTALGGTSCNASGHLGKQYWLATSTKTCVCSCAQTGASSYAWTATALYGSCTASDC